MKQKKDNPIPLIYLDNIKIQLQPPDLDGDGERGTEYLTSHPQLENSGITHLQQRSELAESLDKLDEDEIDPETKMSKIDLNANLNVLEKNGYGVLDFLVSVSFLPDNLLFLSRQFKRLSVSVGGLGRSQKTQMVTGQREHQRGLGGSLLEKAKGLFSGGENNG